MEEWIEELKAFARQIILFAIKQYSAKIVECDDIQIAANLFIIAKRKKGRKEGND